MLKRSKYFSLGATEQGCICSVPTHGQRHGADTALLRGTRTGFTLIELVLVMLIVAIAMGIVAPSLSGFLSGRKTVNAVNQIVALARHARSQAISDGKTIRLNVDTQSGQYWLEAQDGANFADLGNEHGQRYSLPDGVKAEWRQDENAPEFPVNTINDQRGSIGSLSGGLGGSSGAGAGGLGGAKSGGQNSGMNNTGAPGGMGNQKGNVSRSSVSFYPDGRNESWILTLDDGSGDKIDIGAYSETEPWGVLKEDDK